MAVQKHEIPILEYDAEQKAVIMPNKREGYRFPERAVFAFLSDVVEEYAIAHGAEWIGEFESATKMYPIYKLKVNGKEICLCQAPVGAAPSTQLLDFLIACGVKCVISAGSCGTLEDIAENEFLIPQEALRDEGTSYHYLPPSRCVSLNREAISVIQNVLNRYGIRYQMCKTWTTDGFFRETADMVKYRRAEGCQVVEMECAALAACAQFRGISFGQLLFSADSLANLEKHDMRGWGGDSFEVAMQLCVEIAAE